jgi:hypothetical protein
MAKLNFIKGTKMKDPQLFLDGKALVLDRWIERLVFDESNIPVFVYDEKSDDINIPLEDMSYDYAVGPCRKPGEFAFIIRKHFFRGVIVRFWFEAYFYIGYDETKPDPYPLLKDVDKLKEYLLKNDEDLNFLSIEYTPFLDHQAYIMVEIYMGGATLEDIDQEARKFNQVLDSFHKNEY